MNENQAALIERQEAQQAIDHFLNKHQLHCYRGVDEKRRRHQAEHLATCLSVVHSDDVARVGEELGRIAQEIEALDHYDPHPDGHHAKAAEAIRKVASEQHLDACPWSPLYELMASHHVLRPLAIALWAKNKTRSDEWKADLQSVCESVWGDSEPEENKARKSVHDLSKFFASSGVMVDFSVLAAQNPSYVQCEILSIDLKLMEEKRLSVKRRSR